MLQKEHSIVTWLGAPLFCSSQELEAIIQSEQSQGFIAQVTGLVHLSVFRDRGKKLMGKEYKGPHIFSYLKNLSGYTDRSLCQRL